MTYDDLLPSDVAPVMAEVMDRIRQSKVNPAPRLSSSVSEGIDWRGRGVESLPEAVSGGTRAALAAQGTQHTPLGSLASVALPGEYVPPSPLEAPPPEVDPRDAMKWYAGRAAEGEMGPMIALQPVYHGTPHAWEGPGAPLDAAKGKTFDLSKIGTGEGAQAYGWGAYATKEPHVAEQYRRSLAGNRGAEVAGLAAEENASLPSWMRDRIAAGGRGAIADLRAEFERRMAEDTAAKATSSQPWLMDDRIANHQRILSALSKAEQAGGEAHYPTGRLYKLDAPEDEELLHWDKPLPEQPHVIAAIMKDPGLQAGLKPHNFKWRGNEPTVDPSRISMTGEAYYRALADALGEKGAAETLRAAGIPGHLYRGDTSGVENMVIYDPARAPVIDAATSLAELLAKAKSQAMDNRREP